MVFLFASRLYSVPKKALGLAPRDFFYNTDILDLIETQS
ncbi:MAG: hypothetical protein K0R54_4765 [Clostridiaceae bacterium]|nr:hypothetical protein [Clostridiaceae bacterium]